MENLPFMKKKKNDIDYLICNHHTFLDVADFIVEKPSLLSDHCAILVWLNLITDLPASETQSAFHSTKNSGLKFWVFHVTNGTLTIHGVAANIWL